MGLKPERSLLVINAHRSEKTNAAVEIGRYLTEKIVTPQKFEKLISKEKHGATLPTFENNLVSREMLTDAKTTRSDAFFKFTVIA
jgi:hypothetical protein